MCIKKADMAGSDKIKAQEIVDLLESDDEFPDSYNELPEVPAYLNDNRFPNAAESPQTPEANDDTEHEQSASTTSNESEVQEKPERQMKLILTGRLTKLDIFYIKSIEAYASTSTLLWFVSFLNDNVIKPKARSCLVSDMLSNKYYTNSYPIDESKTYYMRVRVKDTRP